MKKLEVKLKKEMGKIIRQLIYILLLTPLFVSSFNVCKKLQGKVKIEKKNLILEYQNNSKDTMYIADFSLTRNNNLFIKGKGNYKTIDIIFFGKSNSACENQKGYGLKIFLGMKVLAPGESTKLVYHIKSKKVKTVKVEYSYTSPKILKEDFEPKQLLMTIKN